MGETEEAGMIQGMRDNTGVKIILSRTRGGGGEK